MTKQILFLCPHNAAKSVYAAATLGARAPAGVSVSTGGTDPDEAVLPVVASRLAADGHTISHEPAVVTAEQIGSADLIINIGCDHDHLPADAEITDWQIPNFSDDAAVAFAALDAHVDALLEHLAE